jgi:hypothetical protein
MAKKKNRTVSSTKEQYQDAGDWTLARLRDSGYGHPIPAPDLWRKVGPARIQKRYYGSPLQCLQFRPSRFRAFYTDLPSESFRPVEEIQAKLDNHPLAELDARASDCLRQMALRARCGDAMAMRFVAERAYNLLRHLELLEKTQPRMVSATAASCDRWPVLLGRISPPARADDPKRERRRYPKELEAVLTRLHNLKVGVKMPIRTGPGRNADRRSYWTRLAEWAVGECLSAGALVKLFKHRAHTFGGVPQRGATRIWNTKVEDTCYYVREGSIFGVLVITDWENRCASLRRPITPKNLPAWQTVVRGFVREYFHGSKKAYREALSKIQSGQSEMDETPRRNKALDHVSQALRTLAVR